MHGRFSLAGKNACVALSMVILALGCSAAESVDSGIDSTEAELKTKAAFPAGSYYQIETARPTSGQISLLMFTAGSRYWAVRCTDPHCATTESLAGSYTRYATTLRFYDDTGAPLGTWAYSLKAKTLSLREFNTSKRYSLNPMGEDLCDQGGGAWTDDDFGPHGFNCICPGNAAWTPDGCAPCKGSACTATCAAPLSACGTSCFDLASDPRNCGACNHACGKAEGCLNGVCSACPAPLRACGSVCTDVTTAQNCGGCGVRCGATQSCVNGACQ